MFIDETYFFYNSKTKILEKEILEKDLLNTKNIFSESEFNTLNQVLNLEGTAYSTPEVFKKYYIESNGTCTKEILKLTRNIYNFNFYYMSLNFIKDYLDRTNAEFKFEDKYYDVSLGYCKIYLTYKQIPILRLKTAYKNILICILSYFSDNLQSFLDKTKNVIYELQSVVNEYSTKNLNVNSNEYVLLRKFETAESLNQLFSNLNQNEIDIINNFYNEFIKYLNISFSSEYKDMCFIAPVDLCHYEIIN